VTNIREYEVAEQFLNQGDDDSFNALFRIYSPQLVSFFRRRGHENSVAEDLAQDVMLTAYRKAGQVRDHRLFRAWLFKVARNAAFRHFEHSMRQVPTVDMDDLGESIAAPGHYPTEPGSEFVDWMKFLDPPEREAMTLRFVEDWEYHEIAAAKSIPVGTIQWRVFNSKRKLAVHLRSRPVELPKAA
jgi:RNA polymerase sigma-70 factor (ECF subfamily)